MTPTTFKKSVWKHYKNHGRHALPWRTTKNPYKILVSEIMLQQTQVDRVIPKYTSFLKKFPSFKALAQAPLRDVLREWKGLGYNRRGLNVKRLAKIVVREHKGKLPSNRETLMKLPGIGPYTAGAVMAFVWNKPETFIETNIRTVFIHHFFSKATHRSEVRLKATRPQSDKAVLDKQLMPLIEKTLDTKNPREWYYALMDYGSYLKKTLGNPSRKSASYTKQSRFEGSNRQLRAQVLHIITENKNITLDRLSKDLSLKKQSATTVVNELVKDGFITKNKSHLSIAD